MYLQELDEKLSKMVVSTNLLDSHQCQKCIQLSKSNSKTSSLAQILLEQNYFPSEILFRLISMIQDSEIICLKCSTRHRGGQFTKPRDFLCQNCHQPLETKQQVVLPRVEGGGATDTWQDHLLDDDELKFEPEIFIGRTLAGVEIRKYIGKGSMGMVFLGYQKTHNRMVALKLISPGVASSKEFINRFQREALTTLQLKHPNIIQVYGGGDDGGQKYIIMEYVQGQTLQDMIDTKGTLAPKEAISIVMQISKGLLEAHNQMIVHRDIKPENIFVDVQGIAKLADFGIAKDRTKASVTQAGSILGTPHYMSPEQVEGKEVDNRTDIYALGATLYSALVGKPPFDGENPINVMYKQVNEPLSFPPEAQQAIHPSLQKLIQWMMAKEKHRRASSSELVKKLEGLCEVLERGIALPVFHAPSGHRTTGPGGTSRSSAIAPPMAMQNQKKSYMMGILIGTILLGLIGVVGLFVVFNKKAPSPVVKKIVKKPPKPPKKPQTPIHIDTPINISAPADLYKKIYKLTKKKNFRGALELVREAQLKFPKDPFLVKEGTKIRESRGKFLKEKEEIEGNLASADGLIRKNPTNLKRIQWASSQYERAINFYSFDSLKVGKLKGKAKKLLTQGMKTALKANQFTFFFWFIDQRSRYGEVALDVLKTALVYREGLLAKKEVRQKKELQKLLTPLMAQTQEWIQKKDSYQKKLQLKILSKKQVQLTRDYYENRLDLYLDELAQLRKLLGHPKVQFEEEYKKNILQFYNKINKKYYQFQREWNRVKEGFK